MRGALIDNLRRISFQRMSDVSNSFNSGHQSQASSLLCKLSSKKKAA
jgi:hypothetical protein